MNVPLDSYTDGLGFILEMIRVRVCFKLQIKLATNFQCQGLTMSFNNRDVCGVVVVVFYFLFF